MYLICDPSFFSSGLIVLLVLHPSSTMLSKYSPSSSHVLIVFLKLRFDLVFLFVCFLLHNHFSCSLSAIPWTLPGGQAGGLQHSLLPHQRGFCIHRGAQTTENFSFGSFCLASVGQTQTEYRYVMRSGAAPLIFCPAVDQAAAAVVGHIFLPLWLNR